MKYELFVCCCLIVSCGGCAGTNCTLNSECASGRCSDSINGTCLPFSCSDGLENGDELGVDCGSSSQCSNTTAIQSCIGYRDVFSTCNISSACTSGYCSSSRCAFDQCHNLVWDIDEDGIDCGGPCLGISSHRIITTHMVVILTLVSQ